MLLPLRAPESSAPETQGAARWRAALDALPDAVLLLDADGRVMDANRAAALAIGSPEDELREDPVALFRALEPADAAWLRAALGRAAEGNHRRGRFARFGPPSSSAVDVEVEPISGAGAVAAVVLRKAASAGKGPDPSERLGLCAVDLAAELEQVASRLREGGADPAALAGSLDRLQRELGRLGRRAVGEGPATDRPEALMEGLVRAVRQTMPGPIRLRRREMPISAGVRCDGADLVELGRCFARLATAGRAQEVVLESILRAGAWALTLTHDGAPLPESLITRLLQPAADDEVRPIDLSYWRSRARYWGGELRVESAPGVGLRLAFTLPLLRSAPAPVRHPERALPRRVLVLEADDALRASVSATLREVGVRADATTDAVGALDAIERESAFDLILLGIELPSPGARHMLKLIRRLRPNVPVMMVGGHTNHALVRECLSSGAQAVLPRRFTVLELRRALESR